MRVVCYYCNGPHRSDTCPTPSRKRLAQLACETPPHNGPYRGTAPVRTLAAGICGRANDAKAASRQRGRVNRWRHPRIRTWCPRCHRRRPCTHDKRRQP